jgi:hypothetical protein
MFKSPWGHIPNSHRPTLKKDQTNNLDAIYRCKYHAIKKAVEIYRDRIKMPI